MPKTIYSPDAECISSGKSKEYLLVEDITATQKLLLVGVTTLFVPLFVLPAVGLIHAASSNYNLEIRVTFRNGLREEFDLALGALRNSFQTIEHVSQVHKVTVQGSKGDQRVILTFENTVQQVQNHEVERLKEEGNKLMSQGKYLEAAAKFNEALQKANTNVTKASIQMLINKLEDDMNKKARVIHRQGEAKLRIDEFDSALEKFQEALVFAKSDSTIVLINEAIKSVNEKKFSEGRCREMVGEATTFISRNQYEEALQKLNQAVRFVKKRETALFVRRKTDETRNMKKNQENWLEFRRKAGRFISRGQYHEALLELEEALNLDIDRGRIRSLIDSTMEKKINQERCETIIEEAERLSDGEQYQEALTILEEAQQFTEQRETVDFITRKKRDIQQISTAEKKSKHLNQEGQKLLEAHRYDEALTKFSTALDYGQTTQTLTLVNNNITKTAKMQENQKSSEKLSHEAESLMANHQYEEALQKLIQAVKFAEKREIALFVMRKIDETRNMIVNQENWLEFRRKAVQFISRGQYHDALLELEEALNLDIDRGTIRSLIDSTMEKKINQERCETIIEEAERLSDGEQYQEALTKLEEAQKFTEQRETVDFITKKKREIQQISTAEEKSKNLNQEGQKLLEAHLYDEALTKFSTALDYGRTTQTLTLVNNNITKTAKMQKNQKSSEKLSREAESLMANHQYEEASKKLSRALELAQKTVDLINTQIKRKEAASLNQKGEDLLSEAFSLEESEESSEEAAQKFEAARDLFVHSVSLWPDAKFEENSKLASVKVKGNECYNVAIELEDEAVEMAKKMHSSSERNAVFAKNAEALKSYKRALDYFEEGGKINEDQFQKSVQLAKHSVSGVGKILKQLDSNFLSSIIEKVEVKMPSTMETGVEEDSEVATRNCFVNVK